MELIHFNNSDYILTMAQRLMVYISYYMKGDMYNAYRQDKPWYSRVWRCWTKKGLLELMGLNEFWVDKRNIYGFFSKQCGSR